MICALTSSLKNDEGEEDVAIDASFCIDLTRSILIRENGIGVQLLLAVGSPFIPG
jgi:hypothetical protein